MTADNPTSAPLTGRSARKWAWIAAFFLPVIAVFPWVVLWNGISPGFQLGTLTGLLLVLLCCSVTYTDLRWKKIPNWATYPAVLWGILLNVVAWRFPAETWTYALGAVGLSPCLAGGFALLGAMFGAMFCIYSMKVLKANGLRCVHV